MKIIDPHVHFFNLNQGQYAWLQGSTSPNWPNLEKIKQPVSATQLNQSTSFELAGLVHIEAGFDNHAPINELHWLSAHLKHVNYKAVAYTCINQAPNDFKAAINALNHPSLIGIRDITEGHEAQRLIHPNCIDNLAHLAKCQLHFEAQFSVENQPITKKLIHYCTEHPHLTVIINHCGLVRDIPLWEHAIAALAQQKNILIKFSGFELLTLNKQQQCACFNYLLQHFGDERVMFASNFPVCQINQSYQQVWQNYFHLCQSRDHWQRLSYDNAKRIYQL
nr:amidohydrolase family protein [Pseudoalteromonas sp. MMG010]